MTEEEILQLLLEGKTLALMSEDPKISYQNYIFTTPKQYHAQLRQFKQKFSGIIRVVQIERYTITSLSLTLIEKLTTN